MNIRCALFGHHWKVKISIMQMNPEGNKISSLFGIDIVGPCTRCGKELPNPTKNP